MAAKSKKTLGMPSATGIPRSNTTMFAFTFEGRQEAQHEHYKTALYSYARKTYSGRGDEEQKQAYNRVRHDPQFRLLYQELRFFEKRNEAAIEQDRSPGGPWDTVLQLLGLRTREMFWEPGDTPTLRGTVTARERAGRTAAITTAGEVA
jgi:hypothetical protein